MCKKCDKKDYLCGTCNKEYERKILIPKLKRYCGRSGGLDGCGKELPPSRHFNCEDCSIRSQKQDEADLKIG